MAHAPRQSKPTCPRITGVVARGTLARSAGQWNVCDRCRGFNRRTGVVGKCCPGCRTVTIGTGCRIHTGVVHRPGPEPIRYGLRNMTIHTVAGDRHVIDPCTVKRNERRQHDTGK